MNFTVKTKVLNDLLTKVAKGVGNNKLLPITSFLKVEKVDGGLKVTATDMNNFITVMATGVEGENGTIIVQADTLTQLVGKTTTETMKFELKEDRVKVKGNGNYTLQILQEEYPTYEFDMETPSVDLEVAYLKSVLGVNKSAVSKDTAMGVLVGYLVGEKVVTTDGVKMCINNNKVLKENVLLTPDMVNLLGSLTGEGVKVKYKDGKLVFATTNTLIYGAEMSGKEGYPDLTRVLDFEYTSVCKVNRQNLISIMNRLNIFVTPFGDRRIVFEFKEDGLYVGDMEGNNSEKLAYENSENYKEFRCEFNSTLFTELANGLNGEFIDLHYGNEIVIKMVEDDITQILGLIS